MELIILIAVVVLIMLEKRKEKKEKMKQDAEDFRRAYDPNDPMTRAQAIMRMYDRYRK